eukprot:COSAG06_NODE_13202_length_1283_cov_1.259291_1_plen_257_part_01
MLRSAALLSRPLQRWRRGLPLPPPFALVELRRRGPRHLSPDGLKQIGGQAAGQKADVVGKQRLAERQALFRAEPLQVAPRRRPPNIHRSLAQLGLGVRPVRGAQLARIASGCLDAIDLHALVNCASRADLEAAFQKEIAVRLDAARELGASTVLLCGVSKVISEQFGEVSVVPGSLCTAKIWIDIAPVSAGGSYSYPAGALADSAARLEAMGIPPAHVAEVVESAQRAVLRDLRDTEPSEWADVAEDWGDDSRFYLH